MTSPAPIHENPDLPTIWVTDCAALSVRDGVVVLTFTDGRLADRSDPPASVIRQVVARLAMPTSAFRGMVAKAEALSRMKAMEAAPTAGSA